MRLLFFLFVFSPLPAVFAASATTSGKKEFVSPAFRVVSSARDKQLKKTEAAFEFHVLNPEYRQDQQAWPAIRSSYNGISHDFSPDDKGVHVLKVAPGSYIFRFYADEYHFEVYSDSVEIKPGFRTVVNIFFVHSDTSIMVDKPVIYLYPPVDITASVTVNPVGEFVFTYPDYADGWNGTAHSDGSMTINGKTYPYLFWEAKMPFVPQNPAVAEGFIVPAEKTVAFLESALTQMGLNTREQTDFITYWAPKMAASDRNLVRFLFNEDCNAFAQLDIAPQPDHLFRVYMLWSPLENDADFSPCPQQLPVVDRTGFYAIEWGGSEVPLHQTLSMIRP